MTITIIADHDTTEAITRHLRWLFVVTAGRIKPFTILRSVTCNKKKGGERLLPLFVNGGYKVAFNLCPDWRTKPGTRTPGTPEGLLFTLNPECSCATATTDIIIAHLSCVSSGGIISVWKDLITI